MSAVKVSPKYQIVIPEDVRRNMDIRPGQKLEVLEFDGYIELVPVPSAREIRGIARGLDTRVVREKDRL